MLGTATQVAFVPSLENGGAFRLQHSLVELIDLALHAKTGALERGRPDLPIAPRAIRRNQRHGPPEGGPSRGATGCASGHGTLVAVYESPLEPFPVGWLPGPTAVKAILARIDHMSRTNLMRIKEIRGIDPVAETILIDLAGELDIAAWMLHVQDE